MRALPSSKSSSWLSCFNLFLILFSLLLVRGSFKLVLCHSAIEFLPGFQGPLPFELETGYVGVGDSEDVQLFYYFVKSETKPDKEPLLLWLTGGPGCSAFSGLIYEIGPLNFEAVEYNGSLPTLVLNPNSWTKVASIIFLDLPVGTGYSYGRTSSASVSTQLQACDQAYQFTRKWLMDHPEFISKPLYIGGDSYSGLTVPIVVQLISDGNKAGIEPFINLKGYLLGNPGVFPGQDDYQIPFAYGMGLISEELYETLNRICGGQYHGSISVQCSQYLQIFNECLEKINKAHILEPKCPLDYLKFHHGFSGGGRSLNEMFTKLHNSKSSLSALYCRVQLYLLSFHWMNNKNVQEALHIRKGSIRTWNRCNRTLPYTTQIVDTRPFYLNLSTKGYRSLVYSGDHDMLVPHQSTQAWIRSLNYSIVDHWRPWLVRGQVAGYTRAYSNRMTFATVKGGGHTAPEYRPEECLAMFKRWISHEPL